jgi:hypothetical protein
LPVETIAEECGLGNTERMRRTFQRLFEVSPHDYRARFRAPMLKIAIPEEVWSRHLCLIVHPGIKGDRGPSSLDWAIASQEKIWGVTILEAADAFDGGPIWTSHESALEADPPAKSSLYRGQVSEAALRGVLEAVARIESGEFRSGSWQPEKLSDLAPVGSPTLRGCLRPPMRQADRAIPKAPLPIDAPADHRTFREIVYTEEDQVGYLRPRDPARQNLLPLWGA